MAPVQGAGCCLAVLGPAINLGLYFKQLPSFPFSHSPSFLIPASHLLLPFPFLRPDITSWDLQTLLIKPIQRILKYPLLLEKLLQCTPKDDPSHKTLSAALITTSKVAQDINELKRRKDLGMHDLLCWYYYNRIGSGEGVLCQAVMQYQACNTGK